MSTTAGSVTSTARARIRSFSVWVWVAGALVLFLGALNTYADVGIGDDGLAIIGPGENPWDVENPPVFEADGTTYSGDGPGLIRIPLEEHNQEPYIVHLNFGAYLDLYMTDADDLDLPYDEGGYPTNVGYLYDPEDEVLVLPPDADVELWVRADEPWEFTLQKAEVAEITDGYATGKGNDFLVYRGDAVSARFVHKGEGIFYVTIQTIGDRSDRPIIDSGNIDQRLSWDPTDVVYISIEHDADRGVWSVDIDELATDAPEPAESEPAESPRGTP